MIFEYDIRGIDLTEKGMIMAVRGVGRNCLERGSGRKKDKESLRLKGRTNIFQKSGVPRVPIGYVIFFELIINLSRPRNVGYLDHGGGQRVPCQLYEFFVIDYIFLQA